MITRCGPRCDVCGGFILPIEGERVNFFRVGGIEQELCCHSRCKGQVEKAGNNWELLPGGPLRSAFIKFNEGVAHKVKGGT